MKRRYGAAVALIAAATVLGAVLAWTLPGCRPEQQPSAGPPKLNVLLITLDTTRADRIGCYGYARAETPAIDALAAKGLRFENAFAHVPLTLPSHACMLTGLLPPEHGLRDNGRGKLGPGPVTLAELFSRRGGKTAAFLASFVLDKQFGLSRGFGVYNDTMTPPADGSDDVFRRENPANTVADRALAWLEQNAGEPFFCWAHFFDPHLPFEPPEPYKSRHQDAYDGEVAFMDAQMKRLLDFLDRRGLRERTLVIAVGDHGESFGAHQEYGHGPLVYETTMHVPLIISLPGRVPQGETLDRAVGVVDVAATVLDVLGWKKPEAMVNFHSLLDAPSRPRASYGESEFLLNGYGWAPLRSLTTAQWRYIQCPAPELYDRAADPGEKTNLLTQQPQVAADLKQQLDELVAGMKKGRAIAVPVDREAIAALKQLGYLSGTAGQARQIDPAKRKDPKAMMHVYNACAKADLLGEAKRYQDVINLIQPLLEKDPDCIELHDQLAGSYMMLNQHDAAMKHIQAYLALDPTNRTMLCNLATVLLGQKKPDQAAKVLRQALRLRRGTFEPVNKKGDSKITVKLHVHLGLAYCELRLLDKSIEQYQQALKYEPEHLEAHNNLANIYNLQGKYADAIRHYETALKQDAKNAALHANLGVAYARLKRLPEAIARYRRSLELKPDANVHINLGDALLADGQTEKAFGQYRAAVRVRPGETRPRLVLGKMLLHANRDAEAGQVFRELLALRRTSVVCNSIALTYANAGRLSKASAFFDESLKIDPANENARNNLGLILCRSKQYGRAIEAWRKGLDLTPKAPMLTYNLAWWLATCPEAKYRNGAEAVKHARALNERTDGKNPQVLDALAAAQAEAGDFAAAVKTATQALAAARADAQMKQLVKPVEERLELYKASKPYHQ